MMSIIDRREGERRDGGGDSVRLYWDVVKWIIGIALCAFLAYSATVNTVNARITAIETKQGQSERRLERMEDKIDRLLERPQ